MLNALTIDLPRAQERKRIRPEITRRNFDVFEFHAPGVWAMRACSGQEQIDRRGFRSSHDERGEWPAPRCFFEPGEAGAHGADRGHVEAQGAQHEHFGFHGCLVPDTCNVVIPGLDPGDARKTVEKLAPDHAECSLKSIQLRAGAMHVAPGKRRASLFPSGTLLSRMQFQASLATGTVNVTASGPALKRHRKRSRSPRIQPKAVRFGFRQSSPFISRPLTWSHVMSLRPSASGVPEKNVLRRKSG